MPIGVPRIIYCWGEELPAQWTDIYNFIFRRRMVFLMQYLDDELCNQICGLLINIHMEDRSKELEKKEMEKSGLFKSTTSKSSIKKDNLSSIKDSSASSYPFGAGPKGARGAVEDLLTSDRDFGIDDNHMLEQYTLQKITTEWLNWNAQFFDYSAEGTLDQPYLYYLAEILNKDFSKDDAKSLYGTKNDFTNLIKQFKNIKNDQSLSASRQIQAQTKKFDKSDLDVYSPFRLLANFAPQNYNLEKLNNQLPFGDKTKNFSDILNYLKNGKINKINIKNNTISYPPSQRVIDNLSSNLFADKLQTSENLLASSAKALGQRRLKLRYAQERHAGRLGSVGNESALKAYNYLDYNKGLSDKNARKQTERVIQEEESKKVFMIINSFGGSVGNGITVHDALQFIKAGSLTLALGVAASAASLALAGGTIGERYVTEGCHTMIHQPEGGLNGQASDIWIDSQEIMKIRLDVAEIYSLSTYRPRHKILRDLDRDFYLTAMETIYYGLADEIATNEVLQDIIEMTSKVWDYHDTKQQRLLETRDSQTAGFDTQTQN